MRAKSVDSVLELVGAEPPAPRGDAVGGLVPAERGLVTGGVAVGRLTGVDDAGVPSVALSPDWSAATLPARSTVTLGASEIGCDVVLAFEEGDRRRPIILGVVRQPGGAVEASAATQDDERLVLTAKREIVLRCGRASLTLTRAGKVLLRGAYLLSRSSGVNRIKGGSVQIN
jgi:hypothetical protein